MVCPLTQVLPSLSDLAFLVGVVQQGGLQTRYRQTNTCLSVSAGEAADSQ